MNLILVINPRVSDEIGAGVINYVIYGSLIQRSRTKDQQRRYAESYNQYVIDSVTDSDLKADLERLHPMQIWLNTSIGMRSFFALDGTNNRDVSILHDQFYAPMLYSHDRDEEISQDGEGFKILYGQELCSPFSKHILDIHLTPFIDIFDRHNARLAAEDLNASTHKLQRELVYQSFKPTLSRLLRERYGQSITKST